MDYAAYFDRYHAGPDIDDSIPVPLPESVAERRQLLAEFRAHHAQFETSIQEWCADNGYDASVVEWLSSL